jgi:phosphatidylserine decarboxylase
MKIAADAFVFLIPLLVITGLLWITGFLLLGWVCLGIALLVGLFFRDPHRKIPGEKGLVLAPADGKVLDLAKQSDGTTRVSIFLSLLDVHINRSPIGGTIREVRYEPGRFRMAFDQRASVENERNVLTVANGSLTVRFSQIAGILARRIVCWKKPGDEVESGERIGLIRFGSRVDVFVPDNVTLELNRGDRVRGGSTVIGRVVSSEE